MRFSPKFITASSVMIASMFFEGLLVRRRRACEILSSGRTSSPNRGKRSVPLALMASIQRPSAEPLTE
jgi:hypothetical protein